MIDAVSPAQPRRTLRGSIRALGPVELRLVDTAPMRRQWKELVHRYHYLGCRKLVGRRLMYLAWIDGVPVAALGWSAASLRIQARDLFVGWTSTQRQRYLDRVVTNARFLLFPWVSIRYLASHLLGQNLRRLSEDWQNRYGTALWLAETFVDPTRFRGTSYRAAGWTYVGRTRGCRRVNPGYEYHGLPKEVYVYVMKEEFRDLIGCRSRLTAPYRYSPSHSSRFGELKMILGTRAWAAEITPAMHLNEEDLCVLADQLIDFHQAFHHCMGRAEHQRLGTAYLRGLLSGLPRKNTEAIALEFLGQGSVRSLQRYMKSFTWDAESMLRTHRVLLAEEIAEPGAMLCVDSSEFPKKGNDSVGVGRQYCGRLGKRENCQSGVFVSYVSAKGYGFVHAQLYMQKHWFSDEHAERRKACQVPPELTFQTKTQIAGELVADVIKEGVLPVRWVGCDSVFGDTRSFVEGLPASVCYFADISSNTKVFIRKPKLAMPPRPSTGRPPTQRHLARGEVPPLTVKAVAEHPLCQWQTLNLGEGANGPVLADVARLRIHRAVRRGPVADKPEWLFLRRMPDGKVKFALSNAPEDTSLQELATACRMRWPIEQCFEEGKKGLGMADYEHRSWPAWHRHMIYVFLAHLFLIRTRRRLKKSPDADPHTGNSTHAGGAPTSLDETSDVSADSPLSHPPQSFLQ